MLKSSMAYVSAMLYRTPSVPKIVWSPDYTIVTYQESSLHLSRLRSGLKTLLSELEEEIAFLTGGIDADIPSDFHLENLNNRSRGFSFLGLPQFANQYKRVLERLMDPGFKHCIANLDLTGKLRWNEGNCSKVMQCLSSIIKKIAVVAYVVPSQPPRGTEYCRWRLSNQDLVRNVFYIYGICFINMQLKTTNLKEALDFIPMFCPPRLTRILCNYLILLRGVEITLSQQISHYARNKCDSVYKEYFLVSLGQHIDADAFGRIFEKLTAQYFGVRLTKRSYRHMTIAMKRELISPNFHNFLIEDDVGDQAAGHGSFEATRTYARVQGELPFLSTDRMNQFRKFSEAWHNALHLGTEMPPEPISIRKARQWTVTNNNGNRSTLMGQPGSIGVQREEANQLAIIDQPQPQSLNISQQAMDYMRTMIENTVKASVQEICGRELGGLRATIQDTITKGITDIETAIHAELAASQRPKSSSSSHFPTPPLAQRPRRIPTSQLPPPTPSPPTPSPPTPELSSSDDSWVPTDVVEPPILSPAPPCVPTPAQRTESQPPPVEERRHSSESQVSRRTPHPASFPLPPAPPADTTANDELDYALSPIQTSVEYALDLLRKALNDPNASFRSDAQEELVRRALDRYETFVCIIPTGGGKSALWNVPVHDPREANLLTIVLEPFLSLIADQISHLTSRGINACTWHSQTMNGREVDIGNNRVMFASFENMGSQTFRT